MLLILVCALVFFDQLVKMWALSVLKPKGTIPLIKDVLHWTYVENKGAAFGILEDSRWLFITLTIILVIYFLYRLLAKTDKLWVSRIGTTLIISGGIGNLIDRIFRGYVVDFIDFRIIDFAVFNIADSCVIMGTILLCIGIMRGEKIAFTASRDVPEAEDVIHDNDMGLNDTEKDDRTDVEPIG